MSRNQKIARGEHSERGGHGVRGLIGIGIAAAILLLAAPTASAAVVRQPYLQLETPTSMTIVWRTDSATDSRIRYGTVQGSLTLSATVPAVVTNHIVTITGLTPSTKYYYDAGSTTAVDAGGTAEHYFVTAPTPGSSPPFRAWIIGDSGTGGSDQIAVRDAMLAYTGANRPNFMLHVGDIAYTSGSETEFTDFHFTMYQDILRHTVHWPTLGNHEGSSTTSGQPGPSTGPYYDAFVLPTAAEAGGAASGTEAYYSFDYGNTHFISLNSYQVSRSASGPMAIWLQSDLASTSAQWIIAFWHHPPYSHGTHNSDVDTELREMRSNILPILEAGGVDLVLSGHSHDYERSYLIDGTYSTPTPDFATLEATGHILDDGNGKPAGDGAYQKGAGISSHGGTVYVVAGHGGAATGGTLDHPVMYFSETLHGSCILDVSGGTLTLTNVRATGVVSDTFEIVKGPQSPKVASTDPPKAAVLTTLPSIQVTFSTGVTGVDAGDLTVNGSPATLLTGPSGGSAYTFSGYTPPGNGHVGVVLVAGGIADASNPGLQFTGSVWSYTIDTSPPRVATEIPARGKDVGVLPSITINFTKAVTGVVPGDLRVDGQPASTLSGVDGSAGPYTFTGFPAPSTGLVNISVLPGSIQDEQAQQFAGDSWVYVLRPHLLINEYLTSNNTAAHDEFGEFDDYVEIYNPANVAVDMSGLHLTDTLDFPAQYSIPSGVTIPAHGHLVFWCDSQPAQGPFHTNFNLARAGEAIGLFDTDENGFAEIDSTSWVNATTDVPVGRFPDGAPGFVNVRATPGATNSISCTTNPECSALTDSCNVGVCSGSQCVAQSANEGQACDDGIACRGPDTCSNGVCDGGPSLCVSGQTCNLSTGLCETPLGDPLPVDVGATFTYFKGTSEPPATWNQASFDDSSWLSGPSGFGYGTDCAAQHGTVLGDMLNGYTSLYVRHLFRIDNPAAVQSMLLTMDYDDAFVAYINGHEVARDNVTGTPPSSTQLANADHECSTCNATCNAAGSFPIDLGVAQLVAGNNVLAIQGHNLTAGSSDFTLIPMLSASEGQGCAVNPECDDSNPCTDDSCVASVCQHVANDANSCSDGIACTTDACSAGTCTSTPACPVGQSCNLGTGLCAVTPVTVTFQQGLGSPAYAGTVDTFVNSNAAQQNANNSAVTPLVVDGDPDVEQALVRFDGIFGNGAGQVPLGATIQSATLTVNVTNASATGMALHRMLQSWGGTSTWNSLTAGISADDVEAVAAPDASTTYNGAVPASFGVSVTSSLAAWSAGAPNLGWAFLPLGTDSIQFDSADVATASLRPRLSVTYAYAPPCSVDADCSDNNVCNGIETCVATVCQPGTPLVCSDGNDCTTDSCNPVSGCFFSNNTNPCSDGDACTANDTCAGGVCVPGAAVNCDDGNVCTDDSCDSGIGCVHAANTGSCDDSSLCTTGDVCSGGTCSGTPVGCPVGETCNPGTGMCETTAVPPLPIMVGDTWRYFKGTQEPAPPPNPPTWATIGFDDSLWLSGPSGFGYGVDGCMAQVGTTLPDMPSSPTPPGYFSIYARRKFDIVNPAAVTSLTAVVDFDDSVIVYVNGVEVGRSASMGGTSGTPTAYNTAAASGHECSACDSPPCNPAQSFSIDPSVLVAGTNVIAIHAHNVSLTSSDFILIPTLSATLSQCSVDAECDDGIACTTDTCVTGACDHQSACPGGQTCNLGSGVCENAPVTVSFQEGIGGYLGTTDTFVNSNAAQQNTDNSAVTPLVIDGDPDVEQALVRFDGIFGNGPGQIPPGATIQSATLTVNVTNVSTTGMALHRMLQPWSGTSTWNSLTAGVSADDVEAVAAADASTTYNGTVPALFDVSVTSSVAAWSDGATNLGWAFLPNGTDSIQFDSADVGTAALRPKLTVVYVAGCTTSADCDDGNLCNGVETCDAGQCLAGTPLACTDGNPCTTDSCDALTGCQFVDNTASCDDGLTCTTGDTCSGGSCAGTPVVCDDGVACTIDTCVEGSGCQSVSGCPGDGSCNAQTGTCTAARMECSPPAIAAGSGSTADLIVVLRNLGGLEPVRGYQTQISIARTSGTGTVSVECPGGVVVDDARPDYLYFNSPDDFSATNCALRKAASSLLSGGVTVGPTPAYLSGYTLTTSPDATAGSTFTISLEATPGSSLVSVGGGPIDVDLGPACTLMIASCGSDAECDDANPCTVDTCDLSLGCQHTPGNAGSVCRVSTGACDAVESCTGASATCPTDQSQPDGTSCSDGNACTTADTCQSGTCVAGAPVVCDDSNPCTDDACNPLDGMCAFVANDANSCTDGNVCTANACSGGTCVATPSGVCGVTGTVRYYRDDTGNGGLGLEPSAKPVPDVGVDATQDATSDATSDGAGTYGLSGLSGNVTLTTVAKFGSPRASDNNGAISSFDASVVARGAALLVSLTPNQQVAADVTGDGTVSAFDASFVARFAAGLIDHFDVAVTTGSDWKFLRCDAYAFPGDPGCGSPSYTFTPISQAESGKDFYAILYGDVTGNWQPASQFASMAEQTVRSLDETAVVAGEATIAARRQGAEVQPVRDPASPPAEISIDRLTRPLRRGERRSLTVRLDNADGILGLDLRLKYDQTRIRIVGVQPTGIASGWGLAHSDRPGVHRITTYGVQALVGSGAAVVVTVEGVTDTGPANSIQIDGVANEGTIPIRSVRSIPSRGAESLERPTIPR